MRSDLIEIVRKGGYEGSFNEDRDYLVIPGKAGIKSSVWTCEFTPSALLSMLAKMRYLAEDSDEDVAEARDWLAAIAKSVLESVLDDGLDVDKQFDLVLHNSELSSLPFEAVMVDGKPLFVGEEGQPRLIVTRRIRSRTFREHLPEWPDEPRVLYAWAHVGKAVPVPDKDHLTALRTALRPWTEVYELEGYDEATPDPKPKMLDPLPSASLEAIRDKVRNAIAEGKPYSHVHVLAHGAMMQLDVLRRDFGIELHSADGTEGHVVSATEFAEAVCVEGHEPIAVTLATCDSGNVAIGGSSVAQELQRSGVPIVLGSQFPLTMHGSSRLVEHFYTLLFQGRDVRDVVHDARVMLWQNEEFGHDWMSVVAYIQLPEAYQEILTTTALKSRLAALKTARGWVDFIEERRIDNGRAFDYVDEQLGQRRDELRALVPTDVGQLSTPNAQEALGLLGSTAKRRAELAWLRSQLVEDDDAGVLQRSTELLTESAGWYRMAFDANLSSHWNGIQQAALEAVTTGTVDEAILTVVDVAAEKDMARKPDDPYPYGSRAEAYLLSRIASGEDKMGLAGAALDELRRLALKQDDKYPITATRLQFQRYVNWWTAENGFFDGEPDLAADASVLLEHLD